MRGTTNLTQIDILGSAEKLVSDVLVLIVKYVAIVAALALMPLAFTAWPLWVFWRDPTDYLWFTWVAATILWATPFSCAFYMFFLSHWHSIRRWQREGKDLGIMGSNWHAAHGGIVCTTLKSFFFMFVGLVGSFLFEILYLRTSNYIGIDLSLPDHGTEITLKYAFGYALLPTAAFAPVILLCLWRWFRNRELRRSLSPPSSTLSEIARAVGGGRLGEMDPKQVIRIAQRGPVEAALVGQALEDHCRDLAAGYREAARQVAEERREKLEAGMKSEREANLLRSIDAQIARIGGERATS